MSKVSTGNARDQLRELLAHSFGFSELKDLCSHWVDYEDLEHSNKRTLARELVRYLERQDKLNELRDEVQKMRPDLSARLPPPGLTAPQPEAKVDAPKQPLDDPHASPPIGQDRMENRARRGVFSAEKATRRSTGQAHSDSPGTYYEMEDRPRKRRAPVFGHFGDRIVGVLKLSSGTFAEIAADHTATVQAMVIVGTVAVAIMFGGAIGSALVDGSSYNIPITGGVLSGSATSSEALDVLVASLLNTLGFWIVATAIISILGNLVFQGNGDLYEIVRIVGFAQAPRVLSLFSFIPCFGVLVVVAGLVWSAAVTFIGVREGLELQKGQAFLTVMAAYTIPTLGSIFVNLALAAQLQ